MLTFNYYTFVYGYKREPIDLEDWFSGLACLSILKKYDGVRL